MSRAPQAPVITVDGPVGSGKGAVSFLLAEHLDFHLLDSGALYRIVALARGRRGIPDDDEAALASLASELDMRFERGTQQSPVVIMVDGEDVSEAIRSESCGQGASQLAAMPAVRTALLKRQRACRRAPGLVADGRDMGTVVFPAAKAKIYLTASPEERAQRRYKQLIAKGIGVNLAALRGEITERDKRDRERAVAPLKPAEDAVTIDTTGLDVDAVMARAMEIVALRGLDAG